MTSHKSVLQTGTTDPARCHCIGVTNDEAEKTSPTQSYKRGRLERV
jgi:hypothetical protein